MQICGREITQPAASAAWYRYQQAHKHSAVCGKKNLKDFQIRTIRSFCAQWQHTVYITLGDILYVACILYVEYFIQWTITFLKFEFEFTTFLHYVPTVTKAAASVTLRTNHALHEKLCHINLLAQKQCSECVKLNCKYWIIQFNWYY